MTRRLDPNIPASWTLRAVFVFTPHQRSAWSWALWTLDLTSVTLWFTFWRKPSSQSRAFFGSADALFSTADVELSSNITTWLIGPNSSLTSSNPSIQI